MLRVWEPADLALISAPAPSNFATRAGSLSLTAIASSRFRPEKVWQA